MSFSAWRCLPHGLRDRQSSKGRPLAARELARKRTTVPRNQRLRRTSPRRRTSLPRPLPLLSIATAVLFGEGPAVHPGPRRRTARAVLPDPPPRLGPRTSIAEPVMQPVQLRRPIRNIDVHHDQTQLIDHRYVAPADHRCSTHSNRTSGPESAQPAAGSPPALTALYQFRRGTEDQRVQEAGWVFTRLRTVRTVP